MRVVLYLGSWLNVRARSSLAVPGPSAYPASLQWSHSCPTCPEETASPTCTVTARARRRLHRKQAGATSSASTPQHPSPQLSFRHKNPKLLGGLLPTPRHTLGREFPSGWVWEGRGRQGGSGARNPLPPEKSWGPQEVLTCTREKGSMTRIRFCSSKLSYNLARCVLMMGSSRSSAR